MNITTRSLLALALTVPAAAQVPVLTRTLDTPRGPLLVRTASIGAELQDPLSSPTGVGNFIPLGEGVEGDAPISLAWTPDGTTAIVACRDSDTLEFYDAANGARLGGLQVAARPVHVALTPDGQKALVACHDGDVLDVVDVASQSLLHRITVPSLPYRVVPLSDGVRAVVGSTTSAATSKMAVVDVATGQLLYSFPTTSQRHIGEVYAPWVGFYTEAFADFAVTPDDTKVVLPSFLDFTIRLYDLSTGAEIGSFSTPSAMPSRVDIARSGAFAAVSCMDPLMGGGDRVVTIDLATLQQADIAVSGQLFLPEVRITPDESSILVGTLGGIEVLDVATGNTVTMMLGGHGAGPIEFTHDDAYAIAATWSVTIIDLASFTAVGGVATPEVRVAAVDPTSHRAISLSPCFDERLVAFTTDGALAQATWRRAVGVPVEVDAPYALDLTGDGRRAAVCCVASENLAYVDLETGQTLSIVPTSGPSHALAVSPTEELAVAVLDEASAVAVVDLTSGQMLIELPVTGAPRDVAISADGERAYVQSADVGDGRIAFIDLDGATSSVSSEIRVPGAIGSGLSLSPDGTTLAMPSFHQGVTLLDTRTETVITQFQTTSQVEHLAWSADSTKLAWIKDTHSLSVLEVATSTLSWTPGVGLGVALAMDATGDHAYVLSGGVDPLRVRVYDSTTLTKVAEIPLPGPVPAVVGFPHWAQAVGDQLLCLRTEESARLWRLSMDGASSALLENFSIPREHCSDVAVSSELGAAVLPTSIHDDGLRLVEFGGEWTSFCGPAVPNSSGASGEIAVAGTLLAGDQPLRLEASNLPLQVFGYFLVADNPGFQKPPGSQGYLCLGGNVGGFISCVGNTGTTGRLTCEVDTTALPLSPPVAVQPGDVWYFQAWFRDKNPTSTTNFTDSAQVTFR